MQDAITWIYIDQDIRRYITWFGHNELSPKADLRIVLGSLTQAFWMESDVRLPISWSSILGLPSQFLKLNFSLSHPENLISYIIHYRLTCPGANFTGKAPKPKFYSPGVTGRPYTCLACRVMSFLYKVIDIGSTMMPCSNNHLTRDMRPMVLITIILYACALLAV